MAQDQLELVSSFGDVESYGFTRVAVGPVERCSQPEHVSPE